MIEDNIKNLRKAASISNTSSSDKLWCAMAGNEEAIDTVTYETIASNKPSKILYREHVIFKESYMSKKINFILLYGDAEEIRDLCNICQDKGGAFIQIAPHYVKGEENLLLFVGPETSMMRFIANLEKSMMEYKFIMEDKTTGFIETDINLTIDLPELLGRLINPLFQMSDVVLSTLLISAEPRNINMIENIAKENRVFIINFNDVLEE